MTRLFVDTNVILDVLLDRSPHSEAASKLFSLADTRQLYLTTSALSLVNVEYFLRKATTGKQARSLIAELRNRCGVATAGAEQVDAAILSTFSDFEDAYQHACAISAGCAAMVTRDQRGFKKSTLPVFTAAAFITSYLSW